MEVSGCAVDSFLECGSRPRKSLFLVAAGVFVCMYVCMYIYIYRNMYVCLYIYLYLFITYVYEYKTSLWTESGCLELPMREGGLNNFTPEPPETQCEY